MDQLSIEKHNQGFTVELFQKAQKTSQQAVEKIAKLVVPGMKESEAYKLMAKELLRLGTRKFWHPIHIRFGQNTLLGYKEKEVVDPVLKENDVFFFDIGPIFEGHEADYGKTFFVGDDPLHKKASEDVKTIFDHVRKAWKVEGLTGVALFDFLEQEVKNRGWGLGPSYVRSHRISTFPHSLITKSKLPDLTFTPGENVWILEVQIRHPELPFGAFFEDVL